MEQCEQMKDLNVLQHGELVWYYTKRLISKDWKGLKIPDWFEKHYVKIIANLHQTDVIKRYNVYHDCGKPDCLEYDEEGKKHFPNHAQVSHKVWSELYPNDKTVSNLIKHDMCLHSETLEQIKSHNWDLQTTMTLLVTSLAELHANASMFGGIESTSFKIKYKKIYKRGKSIVKEHFEHEELHEYCYVIVRKDLSPSQQAVQGGHALIEATRKFNFNLSADHPSVIFLQAKNEYQLSKAYRYLLDQEIDCTAFAERDTGNDLTAIATNLVSGSDRNVFKKFRLL